MRASDPDDEIYFYASWFPSPMAPALPDNPGWGKDAQLTGAVYLDRKICNYDRSQGICPYQTSKLSGMTFGLTEAVRIRPTGLRYARPRTSHMRQRVP